MTAPLPAGPDVPACELRVGDWVWHRRLECWRRVLWVRGSGTALMQFGFGDGVVGATHRDTTFRVRADRPVPVGDVAQVVA